MSVIITVGLRQEWCDFGQSRMVEMGIIEAHDSTRINLSSKELMHKMSKSLSVSVERSRSFRQMRPGKTWQIAAADLFLENSEHDAWGWSDPNNLFFLDFWKDFDPECQFVLIYGSLSQYAAYELSDEGEFSKKKQSLAARWQGYHQELMRFYCENEHKCLLVNIKGFDLTSREIVKGLKNKFDIDTRLINTNYSLELNAIKSMAAQFLLNADDLGLELYSELENSADIPSEEREGQNELSWKAIEANEELLNRVAEATEALRNVEEALALKEAWFEEEINNVKLDHENQIQSFEEKLKSIKDLGLLTEEKLLQQTNLNEILKSEINLNQKQLLEYEEQLISSRSSLTSNSPGDSQNNLQQAANNELLLLQLAQVQEELEFYFNKYIVQNNSNSTETEQNNIAPNTPSKSSSSDSSHFSEWVIDLRKYVNGEGWHSPELHGRWAGIELDCTVKVRPLTKAAHKIEMTIIDAMSFTIVKNLEFYFDGHKLKPSIKAFSHLTGAMAPIRRLKASLSKSAKPYPLTLSYIVPETLINDSPASHWIKITAPETQSPADKGENDFRELSFCVVSIKISRED